MARKIEKLAREAIKAGKDFKRDNTEVICFTNGDWDLLLHNNLIAKKHGENITVTFAGWQTPTTKSRLNNVIGCCFFQNDWTLYHGTKEVEIDPYGTYNLKDLKIDFDALLWYEKF